MANNFERVWRGTYTEKDGTAYEAEISVDADLLAKYFGGGRFSNPIFRKARKLCRAVGFRLSKSVKLELKKIEPQETTQAPESL